MPTLIEKVAQYGLVEVKARRARAVREVVQGATTGTFLGGVFGRSTKAALIGSGLGALYGAASEVMTRSVENEQKRQIDKWRGRSSPKRSQIKPFKNAEYGSSVRGHARAKAMKIMRSTA